MGATGERGCAVARVAGMARSYGRTHGQMAQTDDDP